MRHAPLVLAALVATALPAPAAAQHVTADIRIGSGPVGGRIIVGEPIHRYSHTIVEVAPRGYGRPAYREVAVSRMHRGYGWWRNRGYRTITVWYDAGGDRYYDHGSRYRDGLREVVIYERDGRYYDDDRGRYAGRRYDRRHHDRDDNDYDRDGY